MEEEELEPSEFDLVQCYPNPFNAATTIEYSLSQPGDVVLSVYNIRGQKVETIIDGLRGAGKHSVTWNAGDIPSGIYFVRLQSQYQSKSMKLLLLK